MIAISFFFVAQNNLIEEKIIKNNICYHQDYHKFGDWVDDLWVPPYDIEHELLNKCRNICKKFSTTIIFKFIDDCYNNRFPKDLLNLIITFLV